MESKNSTIDVCIKTPQKRGPKRIFTDRERQERKNNYGRDTEWYCVICDNGKNYAMRGKHAHLKTEKHKLHVLIYNLKKEKQ